MLKYVLMNMCMICDNANRVLIQDKIHSRWSGITFPGGHIDDGESIYESTVREVKEETGLTVSNLKQAGLIHMFNTESQERRIIRPYASSFVRYVPPIGVSLHPCPWERAGVEARIRKILIRGAKNMVVVKQLNTYMMKVGVDYAIC